MPVLSKQCNLVGVFAFIVEGILVATAAAFTMKYKIEVLNENCDDVTVALFGNGTCNNGRFFEYLNMAALWKLPNVFVVENNLWAIWMSHLRETHIILRFGRRSQRLGCRGVNVDRMDVLKVSEVATEAIGRARRGEDPTLVECENTGLEDSLADPDELQDPAEKAKCLGSHCCLEEIHVGEYPCW